MALMTSASTACMLTRDLPYLAAILGLIFAVLLIGGANLRVLFRHVRGIFVLIAFLFVIQIFFSDMNGADAQPLVSAGDLVLVRRGGFLLASALALRLLVIVFAALVLLEGEIRDYLLALVQMKIPYEIAFMTIIGLHFLPILKEEAIQVYRFMQLRGKDFKKIGPVRRIRAYAELCIPIFAGALRRAEETSIAMNIRGFRAMPGRTNMRRLTLRALDVILIILWPAAFIALHFLFM
jgi:energy-coupling factor transport system permease protein